MKYKSFSKSLICFICSVVCALSGALCVSAEDEVTHITILGDSISYGYGLDENDKNYGGWLEEYYDAQVDNFAVNGMTTQELMDIIDSDSSISQAVEDSELVCVSIGGNDVLGIFYEGLMDIADGISMPQGSGGSFNISPETIQNIIIKFSSALAPASSEAGENIKAISQKLSEINPGAKLVFQTIYNPFETDDESMNAVYSPLHTFTGIYLAVINNAIKKCDNIITADIHDKFSGSCVSLTNIKALDIHPNKLGHLLIAEEIIQDLALPGNANELISRLDEWAPEGLNIIPEDIRNEFHMLADGKFRTEESISEQLPSETEKNTEPEKTQKKTEVAADKHSDNIKKSDNRSSVIISVALIVLILIIFTAVPIIIYKTVRKKQN